MNKETSNTSAPLDWYTLLSLLPLGWEEQAREAKAFVRARKFPTPGEFLRMLLLHVAGDLPLSETAAFWSLDETQITHMTIQRGLERCPEWIEWICNQLIADLNVKVRVSESTPGAPLSEIPVILVDGTTIRQPGSAGTNQRVHLALNVRADHTAALLGTDAHTGEKFGNFVIAPGALYIGDRGYGNRAGIAHVVRGGGYVLVRINAQNLPLDTPDGERFDLLVRSVPFRSTKPENGRSSFPEIRIPPRLWGGYARNDLLPRHAPKRSSRFGNSRTRKGIPSSPKPWRWRATWSYSPRCPGRWRMRKRFWTCSGHGGR